MTFFRLITSRLSYLFPMGALLLAFLALRLADPAPIAQLRLNVFDTFMRLAPRQLDPDFPVKVVAIDEASLGALGQWPWPRNLLGKIVDRLHAAGAKTVSFDIVLPEADRMSPGVFAQTFEGSTHYDEIRRLARELPSNDQLLAASISKAPVILGLSGREDGTKLLPMPLARFVGMGDAPKTFIPSFSGGVASLAALNEAATGLGAVNWVPDQDLLLRRVPLLMRIGDQTYPSLALEALRVGEGVSTILYKGSGGSSARAFGVRSGIEAVKIGKRLLPTNERGEMWLRFAPSDPRRTISAHTIIDGSFDPNIIKGRHILIGASAVGLLDLRATPLADAVPGVEVHAQALEQMLSGSTVERPSYALGFELVFLVVMGGILAWLIGAFGPALAATAGLVAIAGVIALSWLSFVNSGALIDPVYPSLALAALYMAGSLTTYVHTERERNRVRTAFSSYVAPQVVEELARDPGKLKLGGESREVTLLFSDVRNFSRFAEHLAAEELVSFVNRLFTPLADIILEERGTIDKFMGDAVMAFWNAPVRDKDHARLACRAALRMMQSLDELNATWERIVVERGETYIPVRIGIGLNTGTCCVGNVGSPQRFDYSILGDVVNVAARLETATKTYGTGIIVGERTVEAADGFAFLELDRVVLKGKSQPESIYALVGDEGLAASGAFAELKCAHARLIDAVRTEDAGASKLLSTCEAIGVKAYAPIANYFKGVLAS